MLGVWWFCTGDVKFTAKEITVIILKSGVTRGERESRQNLMFHSSSVLKQDSAKFSYHLVSIILVRAHG